jgi:alpha-ketoglutarate-dependent taurine dioxygenase
MERRTFTFSNSDKATFGNNSNEFNFHADYMYTPLGALQALSLWAQVVDQQAPTTFANMVNAVRLLPDDLRAQARTLVADNLMTFAAGASSMGRDRMSDRSDGDPNSLWPHSQHPVISRHPVTGGHGQPEDDQRGRGGGDRGNLCAQCLPRPRNHGIPEVRGTGSLRSEER